jgi:hypothetical protein
MGHIMDPQRIKSIVVMDLVCETSPCALKDIDTIYPKTYELLGNLVSCKPPSIINALIITLVRLSLLECATTLSKHIRMGIFT